MRGAASAAPFTPVELSTAERAFQESKLEEFFPGFEIVLGTGAEPYHVARGTLRPFDSLERAEIVAANMLARRPLSTDYDGLLYPSDETLQREKLRRSARLLDPQEVEVVFVASPDAHQVFMTNPVIDTRAFSKMKHLYFRSHPGHAVDSSLPREEACIVAHQDRVWDRSKPVALLLNHVAEWIGAFRLFAYGEVGEWPLPEAPHSPIEWYASTPVNAPCPCGRGAKYGECHRPGDLRIARSRFLRRYAMFPNGSRPLFP